MLRQVVEPLSAHPRMEPQTMLVPAPVSTEQWQPMVRVPTMAVLAALLTAVLVVVLASLLALDSLILQSSVQVPT